MMGRVRTSCGPLRPPSRNGEIPLHVNRGLVFWGIALVTAGIVALAVQQGYLDRASLTGAWRLWPVVLIAIGLSIILARTPFAVLGTIVAGLVVGAAGGVLISVGPGLASCGGGDVGRTDTSSGEFTLPGPATVRLDFNCGTLDLGLTDGNQWDATTSRRDDTPAQLEATANSLEIRSPDEGLSEGAGRQQWTVDLGSDITYDLSVSVNAATSTFDLARGQFSRLAVEPNAGSLSIDVSGAQVTEFSLSMNAGAATMVIDEASELAGVISMNAGSLELCAAPGTAVQFIVDANLTFAHNLDESGLDQAGDTFTSPGFEGAAHKVVLRLEGNAASFDLNPEDGCA
jgi:cell wall-active antibiotic response 4TMS protein YvqF